MFIFHFSPQIWTKDDLLAKGKRDRSLSIPERSALKPTNKALHRPVKVPFSKKQVGIPTKAQAGFSLKGWFLRGRPLQGFGKHFRQDLTGLNKIRQI